MKVLFKKTLVAIAMIFVIMCPMIVKADLLQLYGEAYSKYVSVGSEFIYAIEVGENNFNGIVTFDSAILEVKEVKHEPNMREYHTVAPTDASVTYNVNGNQLNVNFTADGLQEFILVTFKVKAYPNNGVTTVKVKSNTSNWFGEPSSTMNVIKPSECPSCPACEKDEVSCPVCEECEVSTDNEKEPVNTDSSSDSKDILLYSALGACGFLAVMVVILAFRRK